MREALARQAFSLEVFRFAFYDWHKHLPSARQLADGELGERR